MHPGISWMGSVEFEELLGRQTKVGARLDQLQTSLGPTGPIILEDTSSSDSNVFVILWDMCWPASGYSRIHTRIVRAAPGIVDVDGGLNVFRESRLASSHHLFLKIIFTDWPPCLYIVFCLASIWSKV